jgi:hypothetical protein
VDGLRKLINQFKSISINAMIRPVLNGSFGIPDGKIQYKLLHNSLPKLYAFPKNHPKD